MSSNSFFQKIKFSTIIIFYFFFQYNLYKCDITTDTCKTFTTQSSQTTLIENTSNTNSNILSLISKSSSQTFLNDIKNTVSSLIDNLSSEENNNNIAIIENIGYQFNLYELGTDEKDIIENNIPDIEIDENCENALKEQYGEDTNIYVGTYCTDDNSKSGTQKVDYSFYSKIYNEITQEEEVVELDSTVCDNIDVSLPVDTSSFSLDTAKEMFEKYGVDIKI